MKNLLVFLNNSGWLWLKIASPGRQEPQPAGTAKWQTTLRFGKILGTTSVVRSIENPQDVLQKFQVVFIF